MESERSDEYYVARLIGRLRLLLATSDEVPVETKLETQPMLRELEDALADPPEDRDLDRARSRYDFLCERLEDEPDLNALLLALRNFVPGL